MLKQLIRLSALNGRIDFYVQCQDSGYIIPIRGERTLGQRDARKNFIAVGRDSTIAMTSFDGTSWAPNVESDVPRNSDGGCCSSVVVSAITLITKLTGVNISAVRYKSLRRNTMKCSMKDKVKGTFHEAKGKVNEMTGKVTDNPTLEAKGRAEKIAGKVQEKIGQVKKVLGK